MKTRTQQGFTLIELLVVITIIAILASLAVPTFGKIQEKGNQTKGISNCRQIITALRIYSSDNNGNFPGQTTGANAVTTANDAFRELFASGVLSNEIVFGCPASRDGNPDGKIGTAPAYSDAVVANENHWALTGDQNDSAAGIPLVFENPNGASWNPTWTVSSSTLSTVGRAWSGGKIIIGTADSSVSVMKLTPTGSLAGNQSAPAAQLTDADNLFKQNDPSANGGSGAAPTVLIAQ